MCGIAGLLDPGGARGGDELATLARAMAETLCHRGPDDAGTWAEAEAGIALGSRRLAVIDLSAEGHQPMISESGRFVVAYNGEIYNFGALRTRLESVGIRFKGHSDTEVLLSAIEAWGLVKTLKELNGMYAFALWDRANRRLHLVRDRLGEKPLYFGWVGPVLVFGSELKALRRFPAFHATIDRRTLARYLGLGCVPAPYTIYEGIRQVMPGSMVSIDQAANERRYAAEAAYWSAFEVASAGVLQPLGDNPPEIADRLDELLGDAVEMRLQADVPVGAFLSGGIDSSTIVALMRARSSGNVRTFTIGFDDLGYDESIHAAAVARHLGTDHTEFRLSSSDALEAIPKLPELYDDPFADASQIPTYLVSRLAREHVTVSLSGDGGDELFGGYNRHAWGGPIWTTAARFPVPVRRAVAAALASVSPSRWDALFDRLGALLPPRARLRIPGLKMQKIASVLPARSPEELYRILTSKWPQPGLLVRGVGDIEDLSGYDRAIPPEIEDLGSRMMYLDLVTYLPDDILVKLDRASMGVSLESRVPMLDHRVVEFAWQIPVALKIRNRTGKWILREVLRRYVPEELIDRPKAGFGLPVGAWLRGPLRAWAEDLLAPDRLEAEGYLDTQLVTECWKEHLSGRRDLEDRLWAVLMFQAWLGAYPF